MMFKRKIVNSLKQSILLVLLCLCVFPEQTFGQGLTISSANSYLVDEFNTAKTEVYSLVVTGTEPGYIPAYWGSYRSRECFCSRDICHQVEAAHLLGLDLENFSMLKTFASDAPESNDYWPKWSFDFYGNPYFVDADFKELPAPFENVEKIYEQYLWTGDTNWIYDEAIFTYCYNTVNGFINVHDENGNGIAEMHTDLSTYWEQETDDFIEAGDAFANQYRSVLAFAGILEARNELAEAEEYFTIAEGLRLQFENEWFDIEENTYIRGFDVDGNYKTDFGHENSFFMPMKGITDLGLKTSEYINFCHNSIAFPNGDNYTQWDYNSGINIEAKTYLPQMGYFNNKVAIGWHWLYNIMQSNHPYPEVSFLIIGNIVTGMMGVSGDSPANRLTTLSKLNHEVEWIQIDNIPLGGSLFNIKHIGQTSSTATLNSNTNGSSMVWQAQFFGEFNELLIDGMPTSAQVKDVKGSIVTYLDISISPGQTVTASTPISSDSQIYLSDLNATYSTSQDGDMKRDVNSQGYAISIDGNLYEKGLGVKGISEVRYNLSGEYYRFSSDFGIDDARTTGSGTFQVIGDGVELFNSGDVNCFEELRFIDINVSGIQELILKTSPSSGSYDVQMNWGNALFSTEASPILQLVSSDVVSDTNNNGAFDPGETGSIEATHTNVGILTPDSWLLLSVVATAGTSTTELTEEQLTSMVNLELDSIHIGPIGPDDEIITPFFITIDEAMPRGAQFELHLTLTDGENTAVQSSIYNIPAPEFSLEFGNIYSDDNGNGVPEPGETFILPTTITNTGTYPSEAIEVALFLQSQNSQFLTFTSPNNTLIAINPGESTLLEFEASLAAATPKGTTFELQVTANDGSFGTTEEMSFTTPYPTIEFIFNGFDSDTDGNKVISAGENAEFYVEIENTGTGGTELGAISCTAIGVNSGFVTVTDPSINLDILYPGETIEIPITVYIEETAPQHMIFNLEFSYSDGLDTFTFEKSIGTDVLWISDARWDSGYSGWGDLGRDKSVQGGTIELNGVAYEKGLGLHANAEIVISLDNQFSDFITDIGVDDDISNGQGSVEFIVIVDGSPAYTSGIMDSDSPTQHLEIDITGASTIKLVLDEATFGISSDHADWAGAFFTSNYESGGEYGCTDITACNYNETAVYDNGTCNFTDECGICGGNGSNPGFDCDGNCLSNGTLIVDMTDSYGDGWNGNILTINGAEFTLGGGSSGVEMACYDANAECNFVTCGGGSYPEEVGWTLTNEDGIVLLSGGSPFNGTFGNCGASLDGCTNPAACNYNPNATDDDDSCCLENCVSLILNDYGDNGWEGSEYTLLDYASTVLYSGTLNSGSTSLEAICLEEGCYYIEVSEQGNNPLEISWIIDGIISGVAGDLYSFGVGNSEPCEIEVFCPTDLNGNGIVETGDLLLLLSEFGTYCE